MVDVASKVQQSLDVIQDHKVRDMPLRADDMPTAALYRQQARTLAMRYICDDPSFVRRIQLKFQSANDFEYALEYLRRINCPLLPSDPQPKERPGSAAGPRQSAASKVAVQQAHKLAPDPSSTTSVNGVPMRPGVIAHQLPSSASASTVSREHVHRFEDGFTKPKWPQSSHFHQCSLEGSSTVPSSSAMPPYRPSSSRDTTTMPTDAEQANMTRADIAPNDRPVSSSTLDWPSTARSLSSPWGTTPPGDDGTLKSIVPPRRELPFSRPGSRREGRPPSSLLHLPSLPTPTLVTETSSPTRPETAPVTSASAKHMKKPTTANHEAAKPQKRPATAGSMPAPPVALHASTKIAASKASQTDIKSMPAQVASTVSLPVASKHAQSSETADGQSPESIIDLLAVDKENLVRYAAQPYATRANALEELILEQLKDPHFPTLCEDVEGCWRRFGLELKLR